MPKEAERGASFRPRLAASARCSALGLPVALGPLSPLAALQSPFHSPARDFRACEPWSDTYATHPAGLLRAQPWLDSRSAAAGVAATGYSALGLRAVASASRIVLSLDRMRR
jgi:hypothetical protein